MSRRQRLHVPGGVYYVVQRAGALPSIFSTPDDYALFERLLAAALRRTEARVHAFCWMPSEIHLALQISDTPVGRLMQGITSRYARSMHQRSGRSGHFFGQRYKAALVDPDAYLLRLVRFIHGVPERAGLASALGAHAFTSHGAYAQDAPPPWLTTRTVLRLLEGSLDTRDYADLMSRMPDAKELELFARAGSSDRRVLGDRDFLANLPRHARTYRTRTTLDQIIQTVTTNLGLEREHVLSSSRQRELTLARALIAWYATERGVATLSEVARRLRRDPSTLSMAVTRYRACRPELFKLTALHDIVPLAPIVPLPLMRRPVIEGWDQLGASDAPADALCDGTDADAAEAVGA